MSSEDKMEGDILGTKLLAPRCGVGLGRCVRSIKVVIHCIDPIPP